MLPLAAKDEALLTTAAKGIRHSPIIDTRLPGKRDAMHALNNLYKAMLNMLLLVAYYLGGETYERVKKEIGCAIGADQVSVPMPKPGAREQRPGDPPKVAKARELSQHSNPPPPTCSRKNRTCSPAC